MRVPMIGLSLAVTLAAAVSGCGSAPSPQSVVTTQGTFVPSYRSAARDVQGTLVDPATGTPLPGATEGNAGM